MSVAGAASAFDTSNYTASSALNSGHWVKIATSEQGIHQISYDQLRALGFEQPEQVQVYGYGAVLFADHTFAADHPDDLTPTATYHTTDGRILFYGDADEDLEYTDNTGVWNSFKLRRNYYDTRSYYFLSDCKGVAEVPECQLPASATASVEESHISVIINDVDNTCPIKGGSEYHNRSCLSGEEVPFEVDLHNYKACTSETYASLVFRFAVCASQATTIPATVTNGKLVDYTTEKAWNIAENDYDQFNYASTIVKFSPTTAGQPVTVTAQLPKITYRYCAYDRYVLRYPRANAFDADCNDLVMYYSSTQRSNAVTQQFSNVDADEVVLVGLDCGQTEGDDREGKSACYKVVQDLLAKSKEQNGSIICAEILGLKGHEKAQSSYVASARTAEYYKSRPCAAKVESAARIFAEYLMENRKVICEKSA